ncbi:MAG: 4Fe-4S dicluster domain-containing protein [candidate division Zixibacteria bacterium]|nr:4Fe-4S dicluster domain-containing protein [candidate division Zixibacteria bacterium]
MKAILTDVTLCIGCQECVAACKTKHNLEPDYPRNFHRTDGLSARNWTSILQKDEHYIRKQCRHCLEPACVSACPVAALVKTPEGAVTYDGSKCIGCRYCMIACPYGIPRYDWDRAIPYIQKCTLCYDLISVGQQPACTTACPTEATIFGERDELLAVAKQRIKDNPDKYINRVFGEHEVGGTSVLYLSDIDLGFMSYPMRDIKSSLPQTTSMAMSAVPPAFVGMGALMGGLYWFCKRKDKIRQQKNDKEGSE